MYKTNGLTGSIPGSGQHSDIPLLVRTGFQAIAKRGKKIEGKKERAEEERRDEEKGGEFREWRGTARAKRKVIRERIVRCK